MYGASECVYERVCECALHCVQVCEEVFVDLERFGERVSGEIDALGRQAELEPPYLR